MSLLIELQERLQEAGAAIGRLESRLAENQGSPSLLANLESVQNYMARLEAEFSDEASERGHDVCAYRLFAERFHPTANSLADALGGFQKMLSVVFDALKNGPKRTTAVAADILRDTELGVAYTYPGSFGVVMTIRNERLLFEYPSLLDDAIHHVFLIAKAEDPSDVSGFAKSLGAGPIRAAYRWAKGHVSHGAGADIEWRREKEVRDSLTRQYPEIEALSNAIESTSDEQTDVIEVVGVLVGADTKSHRFHFASDIGEMRGRFVDAISEEQKATLPARYIARIRRTRKVLFATETEELSYFLLNLEPTSRELAP